MDTAIRLNGITKEYRLYETPGDRIREALSLTGKKYGRAFRALDGITIDVKKGETVGIIGTNGAGKSTLLKIVTGVLEPTSGSMEVNGRIASLLELGAGFNMEYTGIRNILLNGRMMGLSKKEMEGRMDRIIEFADIGDFIRQPVKTYSSGMFARLAFAVSINVEPDILIVDEALSVGDIFFQNKCFRKFEELKEKGVTILFVSHDIGSVRQMCSRVLWIDGGVQKRFDACDLVCDMYMDAKRRAMNEGVTKQDAGVPEMPREKRIGKAVFPQLHYKSSELMSERFSFLSCFILDERGRQVTELTVERRYEIHVVISFFETIKDLILGFVLENNKGLPVFDINNYINRRETWTGEAGKVCEVVFSFELPRIMKGTYVVSTALASGRQERHEMLTWLHGVTEVTVLNPGYNSSYIEIPGEIGIVEYEKENVFLE